MAVVQLPGPPTAFRSPGESYGVRYLGQQSYRGVYSGAVRVTAGATRKKSGIVALRFAFTEAAQKAARAWLDACDGANNVHNGFDPDAGKYDPPDSINIVYDVTGVRFQEDANGWYQTVFVPWREV